MIRPIQTKNGHDQTHPGHNQPWTDFSSFLEIVLVFASHFLLVFTAFKNFCSFIIFFSKKEFQSLVIDLDLNYETTNKNQSFLWDL